MGFKILRKEASDYKEKIRNLRKVQLEAETKRWAAVTQRKTNSDVLDKLIADTENLDLESYKELAKELKLKIRDKSSDLKMIQGNMEIQPALRLLEDQNRN